MLPWRYVQNARCAMKLGRRVSMAMLGFGLILATGCDEDPINPPRGFISISVVDGSGPPVAGVEVRVLPPGLTAATDARGVALFALAPGDYFIEANVCCRGPAFIEYHVPVGVTAGKTAKVELEACLNCD
jgi:hypothetical protein